MLKHYKTTCFSNCQLKLSKEY